MIVQRPRVDPDFHSYALTRPIESTKKERDLRHELRSQQWAVVVVVVSKGECLAAAWLEYESDLGNGLPEP
jgi:hypothetical protein